MAGTDLRQVVLAEAERLPGLEVQTGAPQPGVVAAEQEGILLPGDVFKISCILFCKTALKVNLSGACSMILIISTLLYLKQTGQEVHFSLNL